MNATNEQAGDNLKEDGSNGKKKERRTNRGGRPKGTKSAYNLETMTMPSSIDTPSPPLNIWSDKDEQEYFPNLYKDFMDIQHRWMETLEVIDEAPPEGTYCLKILNADFAAEIKPFGEKAKPGIPYDNDSHIHEFAIFIINMFQACESGSCGGDAYVSIIYVKLWCM